MNYTIPPPTQANRKNADVVRMPAYGRFLSVPTGRLGSVAALHDRQDSTPSGHSADSTGQAYTLVDSSSGQIDSAAAGRF